MSKVTIRTLGLRAYQETHHAMQEAVPRLKASGDAELWLVEHPPVFTQGQAGSAEHLGNTGAIAVVQSDRGGQVTYHGPGQVVVYTLVPLKPFGLHVRALVQLLEQAVIEVLGGCGIAAQTRPRAPGVYVGEAKIASLGLRIRQGVSYHGVALNVAMDLEPFSRIHPCGFPGLAVTQVSDVITNPPTVTDIGDRLTQCLEARLLASAEAHVLTDPATGL